MVESESKNEKPKEVRRFSQEQYRLLKECAEGGDEGIQKWNKRRMNNPGEEILLEGPEAQFDNCYLQNANLRNGHFRGAHFEGAELQRADLTDAHFEGADFREACLQGARLEKSHFEASILWSTHLEDAYLNEVYLEGADLQGAYLEGCHIRCSDLKGANFHIARVDGSTLIWKPKVNRYSKKERYTDFTAVSLDAIRIDTGSRQLLEYNIRRMNWEEWYKKGCWWQRILKRLFFQPFWWISDYGLSEGRIVGVFVVLAIAFACIFYLWGLIAPPGILDYLFVDASGVKVASWLVPVRAIHFSVVIMTVGFTNMHANAHSFWAHILVGLQMILGFVLLGALVTRFAVLFTAGGPAGTFADE